MTYKGYKVIRRGYNKNRKSMGYSGWCITYRYQNRLVTDDFDSKEQYQYYVQNFCSR